MDTQSEQNLIILLFSAALLPPKPTFERLIPVNFLLAQLVIKNSKLGQILFGPLYFCATRRQFKSIATEGGIGNWGCKDAPGIGLSWGEFHSSSLQALNTLSLFSLSALLPLV